MIQVAQAFDLPRLIELRAAVRENVLVNQSLVTEDSYLWFLAAPGIFVWED